MKSEPRLRGPLTPLAVRIGAISWMPKALPVIEVIDKRLQSVSNGRISVLDIAGLPNLMLRVPGRKSGVPRITPLLCVPYDGEWLIAGSYFGSDRTPAWVHNLHACTQPSIAFAGNTIDVTWREVHGVERDRLWAVMIGVWPNFALYETRTNRTIPLFVLTPVIPNDT